MAQKPTEKPDESFTIKLSIQDILTYSIFLVTFGASVYTFFSAIPKLDELDGKVQTLIGKEDASKSELDNMNRQIIAIWTKLSK